MNSAYGLSFRNLTLVAIRGPTTTPSNRTPLAPTKVPRRSAASFTGPSVATLINVPTVGPVQDIRIRQISELASTEISVKTDLRMCHVRCHNSSNKREQADQFPHKLLREEGYMSGCIAQQWFDQFFSCSWVSFAQAFLEFQGRGKIETLG
jgi:hypothetical protein